MIMTMPNQQASEINFLTVKQAAEKFPIFTESSLRRDIFDADKNGLNKSGALIRKGKRIYLIEQRLTEWLLSGAANGGAK